MPITFVWCAPESDNAEPFRFADAWRAYVACRRGKRRSASAQRYAVGLLDRLTDTVAALATGQWKPAAAQAFVVTRPKAREVLAAAFDDRVVHHLLVPYLERQFEPVFIHDVWSNRVGKGIHAAVRRLRGFMQCQSNNGARPAHALQLDLANFFNRIDRRILFGLLRQRLERDALRPADDPRHLDSALARRLLWLCRRLLTGNAAVGARCLGDPADFARLPAHKRLINAPDGKGLPIGNLTSQFFANVYLNELDQFVKHSLKCRHYLRYVDDFVLLADDPATLTTWRDQIRDFLRQRLELELRDAGLIAPIEAGVDFLGYRVRGSHLICRPRVVAHCREKLAEWQRRWVRATPRATVYDLPAIARESLAATVASYGAHFRHAAQARLWESLCARNEMLRLFFVPETLFAAAAAPTGGGGWMPFRGGSRETMPSQPHRIPMRIIAQPPNQPGSQRIGDDVARHADEVVLAAQGAVVKTRLPEADSRGVAVPIDGFGGIGLEVADHTGQFAGLQLQQPVQMVGHQDESQGSAALQVVAASEFADRPTSEQKVGEYGVAVTDHRGDQIDAPRFRKAAPAQGGGMGEHDADYGSGFAAAAAPERCVQSACGFFAASAAPTWRVQTTCRSGGSREQASPRSLRPNWAPPVDTSLPGQWRYFHAQCPHWFPLPEDWRAAAFRPWLLLLQVGCDAEAYADDARRIAAAWPAHGGRPIWRRGLGAGLAWPLRRVPSLLGFAVRQGWHAAWVVEEGYRRRAGKRRVLRRLVIARPIFAAAAAPTEGMHLSCRSGGSREKIAPTECRSGDGRETYPNAQTEFAFPEKGRPS
jgi:RNA-directed DNA polymerase